MTETEEIRHRLNHVEGPGGFTQSYSDEEVDLLVRLGLVTWRQTTSANGWETKIYYMAGWEPVQKW